MEVRTPEYRIGLWLDSPEVLVMTYEYRVDTIMIGWCVGKIVHQICHQFRLSSILQVISTVSLEKTPSPLCGGLVSPSIATRLQSPAMTHILTPESVSRGSQGSAVNLGPPRDHLLAQITPPWGPDPRHTDADKPTLPLIGQTVLSLHQEIREVELRLVRWRAGVKKLHLMLTILKGSIQEDEREAEALRRCIFQAQACDEDSTRAQTANDTIGVAGDTVQQASAPWGSGSQLPLSSPPPLVSYGQPQQAAISNFELGASRMPSLSQASKLRAPAGRPHGVINSNTYSKDPSTRILPMISPATPQPQMPDTFMPDMGNMGAFAWSAPPLPQNSHDLEPKSTSVQHQRQNFRRMSRGQESNSRYRVIQAATVSEPPELSFIHYIPVTTNDTDTRLKSQWHQHS